MKKKTSSKYICLSEKKIDTVKSRHPFSETQLIWIYEIIFRLTHSLPEGQKTRIKFSSSQYSTLNIGISYGSILGSFLSLFHLNYLLNFSHKLTTSIICSLMTLHDLLLL